MALTYDSLKTPHSAGRRPNFASDFDWADSESRLSAATRNHDAYSTPVRRPEMPPLFEMDQPDAVHAVLGCRDAFLVWELTSPPDSQQAGSESLRRLKTDGLHSPPCGGMNLQSSWRRQLTKRLQNRALASRINLHLYRGSR